MYALVDADLFNLLCIPPHKLSSAPDPSNSDFDPATVIDVAAAFCAAQRAFLWSTRPTAARYK